MIQTIIQDGSWTISITEISTFPVSPDDPKYDKIFNPEQINEDDFFKVFSIHVYLDNRIIHRIALIGDGNSSAEHCAVLNGNMLSVLQCWKLYHIRIDSGTLQYVTEVDSLAPNYAIYHVPHGYIIHGEIDITKLNETFSIEWVFSGRDVFCTIDTSKPFQLLDDRIVLNDFLGDHYELDYNGNLLCEILSQSSS